MARQLIICCDGTNNTLTGRMHDTNVLKLIDMLDPDSQDQLMYYDPGVGAPDQFPPTNLWDRFTRKLERLHGLASGKGIYENIYAAYHFLVKHYRAGDQIFLFGFSRGAFTVRCVSGMVNLFGIVRPECAEMIASMIDIYFSKPKRNQHPSNKRSRELVAAQIRDQFTSDIGRTASVHFVGVWDTVASVGMPLAKVTITSDGTTSSKRICHIRQALSLDEHRLTFQPRLYWEAYEGAARSVKQLWFTGVHSDIGGGYALPESQLSDESLTWMVEEAVEKGLRLDPCYLQSCFYHPQKDRPVLVHDQAFTQPFWGVAGLCARSLRLPKEARRAKLGARAYQPVLANVRSATQEKRSVWQRGMPKAQIAIMLVLAVLLFFLTGVLGQAAVTGTLDWHVNILSREAYQKGLAFDAWQRTLVGQLPTIQRWLQDEASVGLLSAASGMWELVSTTTSIPKPFDARYAVWAVITDFGLIFAYGWLLGLFASWAFCKIVGLRSLKQTFPWWVNWLGIAPCAMVLADIVENIMTLLVIGLSANNVPGLPWLAGAVMGASNVIKWSAAGASVLLIVLGTLRPRRAMATPTYKLQTR